MRARWGPSETSRASRSTGAVPARLRDGAEQQRRADGPGAVGGRANDSQPARAEARDQVVAAQGGRGSAR
eukprot:9354172-Pyramimonas_sp.AAC.1